MDPNMPPADGGASSRGRSMIAAGIAFMILSIVAVAARFWSRMKKKSGFGWDDWLILVAIPFFIAQVSVSFWGVYGPGMGAHGNMAQQVTMAKVLTIIQYPYAFALFSVRMSICALFLRIFIQRWVKFTVYTYIFVAFSWLVFLSVMPPAACHPFEANWDKTLLVTVPGASCNNVALLNSYTVNGVWSIILDVVIWALPQALVWRLEMLRATKIALSAVFALGIFDIVVAGIRLAEVRETSFTDLTYTNWPAQFWSCIEVGVAIIVACLPQCKPVFEAIIPKSWISAATGAKNVSNMSSQGLSSKYGGQSNKRPNAYQELDEDAVELTATLKSGR